MARVVGEDQADGAHNCPCRSDFCTPCLHLRSDEKVRNTCACLISLLQTGPIRPRPRAGPLPTRQSLRPRWPAVFGPSLIRALGKTSSTALTSGCCHRPRASIASSRAASRFSTMVGAVAIRSPAVTTQRLPVQRLQRGGPGAGRQIARRSCSWASNSIRPGLVGLASLQADVSTSTSSFTSRFCADQFERRVQTWDSGPSAWLSTACAGMAPSATGPDGPACGRRA